MDFICDPSVAQLRNDLLPHGPLLKESLPFDLYLTEDRDKLRLTDVGSVGSRETTDELQGHFERLMGTVNRRDLKPWEIETLPHHVDADYSIQLSTFQL